MSSVKYDFGSGRSNWETFPLAGLQEAAVQALAREAKALNDYPGKLGHAPLRIAMARRESEREGVTVDPAHVVITNGSMQAVTLTAEGLQDGPGDPIIVEEFSYPGTLSAYRSLRFNMTAIPLDAEGMRLDVLESTLSEMTRNGKKPKFIYTISTYQNPTGFTMSREKRLDLIELGRRFDVPLIEDNCYGDVHYDGEVPPAIYALDADPRHIYLCSLSKILAPGLRLGYFIARPPMLARILARRHDAGSNTLAAAIAAEFYRDGIWAHTRIGNEALRVKRDLILDCLGRELDDVCVWSNPAGGLFIWVRLPDDVDRARLARLAGERGLAYLPGSVFHFTGADVPYLRLAFGHLQEAEITQGIGELARCIREARTSNERRSFDKLFD